MTLQHNYSHGHEEALKVLGLSKEAMEKEAFLGALARGGMKLLGRGLSGISRGSSTALGKGIFNAGKNLFRRGATSELRLANQRGLASLNQSAKGGVFSKMLAPKKVPTLPAGAKMTTGVNPGVMIPPKAPKFSMAGAKPITMPQNTVMRQGVTQLRVPTKPKVSNPFANVDFKGAKVVTTPNRAPMMPGRRYTPGKVPTTPLTDQQKVWNWVQKNPVLATGGGLFGYNMMNNRQQPNNIVISGR